MPRLVGTAADVVDQLEYFIDEGSADGFMLAVTYNPRKGSILLSGPEL